MTTRTPGAQVTVIVSVEHGGNTVPAEYEALFSEHTSLLESHRGWDPGALTLGRRIAAELGAPLIEATVTRLLVDLNRSRHHPQVFSEVTRRLSRNERAHILETRHHPHRHEVRRLTNEAISKGGQVLHLGIHTFTPEFNGVVRTPDLALLYDPARKQERALVVAWQREMSRSDRSLVVRRNNPYRGNADGLTTTLRELHTPDAYLGIEIEVNQKHLEPSGAFPKWVGDVLLDGLRSALGPA